MDEFLQELIAFLHLNNVAPSEAERAMPEREGSFLYDLPAKPDNVFVFRNYLTKHATLTAKEVGVKYIQVLVRNKSQKKAFDNIQKLYKFLLVREEPIEMISPTRWVIFDVREGPTKLNIDEQGRHIWSFSFPVKTSI